MRLEIEPYAVIEPHSSDSGLKFRIFVKSSANEIKTELRQISGRVSHEPFCIYLFSSAGDRNIHWIELQNSVLGALLL